MNVEQFMVKKTELGTAPGLAVNFMRYRSLEGARQLVEGVRMETHALSAEMITITVAEHGFAISVTELLLNASFDDVMASGARLLGRNMALYLDGQCRDVLMQAPSVIYGYDKLSNWAAGNARTPISPYDRGMHADNETTMSTNGGFFYTSALVKDAVETLATKNVPRLGETYVSFVHPHQSRRLRDDSEFIEVTKYAAPGNFMLGEIGRLNDVVFIETTQVYQGAAGTVQQSSTIPTGTNQGWDGQAARASSGTTPAIGAVTPSPVVPATPGPYQLYRGLVIGDNAAGHAISLPVELRDGGVLDFGREHALCWYGVWGLGLITDYAVVQTITN
ncbi:N4-gp56 family major capsid protein [Streptomyces sp. CBMA29]|uniref:N4-gp56 family major capsid protein n=1 Tax=Streptomyces sp. CBMA29 TaxID=1896314 RepID=UPI002948BFB0|nr:N4-gp56 family major capsid protein [Streptomyces sp. CBMA29]